MSLQNLNFENIINIKSEGDFMLSITSQYNYCAEKYSEVVVEQNKDSITAFYKYLDIPLNNLHVLDLGCGSGQDLAYIQSKGAIAHGVDSSEEMVHMTKNSAPNANVQLGFFEEVPYPDQFFDLVISKWALQTAFKIEPIYAEVIRVLKPNGRIIFLICHPMRQFIEKKRSDKDYFQQEVVTSTFFDGQVTAYEPSHTMNEYLSPFFFDHFILEAFEEGFDGAAEKVNGDTYPSFFIIQARRK